MNSWRPAPVNPSWVPSASILCLGGRVKERLGQHHCCTELQEDEGGMGKEEGGGGGAGRHTHAHTATFSSCPNFRLVSLACYFFPHRLIM